MLSSVCFILNEYINLHLQWNTQSLLIKVGIGIGISYIATQYFQLQPFVPSHSWFNMVQQLLNHLGLVVNEGCNRCHKFLFSLGQGPVCNIEVATGAEVADCNQLKPPSTPPFPMTTNACSGLYCVRCLQFCQNAVITFDSIELPRVN